MKRTFLLFSWLIGLLLLGVLVGLGQGQANPPVQLITQIGEPRPRGVQYDSNFDQMAYVDPRGQLMLADAVTYEAHITLYETGAYNAYQFSNNGLYLALAIETRIEVYDTQSGELLSEFLPDGAVIVEGPIFWADHDELVSFDTQVLAPRALRRSENDTVNLPYVWDWQATRRARASILPNGVVAQPFFDYKNGFAYGPNGVVVAGLANRLEVRQMDEAAINLIGDIPSSRNEPDPISVWRSAYDTHLYVLPKNASSIFQVTTDEPTIAEIRLDRQVNNTASLPNITYTLGSRIIGEEVTQENPLLLRWWLGDSGNGQVSTPRTVELIDILEPMTFLTRGYAVLLEITHYGNGVLKEYRLVRLTDMDIVLSPDGNELMVRTQLNGETLDIYELNTGNRRLSIPTALPEQGRTHLLAYDKTGDVILSDFQRFDAQTGEVISENLHLNYGFDQFYYGPQDGQVTTINAQGRWVWDVYTGQVVQHQVVDARGNVLQVSNDSTRYLSQVDFQGRIGREVYHVASGDRRTVYFESIEGRSLQEVFASPNWEHYLVVYSDLQGPEYFTGNAIAMYRLGVGLQWVIAGDDLPFSSDRRYGWIDNETIYIQGRRASVEQAERFYGLDYHGSGLPMCLVDAFPETYTQWSGFWESQINRRHPDALNRLAIRICEALPTDESGVDTIFFPTVTPTRLPITATPSTIAGVPACLTQRFPNEAREYAEIWREVIDGLTIEEIEEQEALLCQSVRGQELNRVRTVRVPNLEVMLINIHTQIREVGDFIPEQPQETPQSIQVITEAMERAGMRIPNVLQFTPDGTRLIGINFNGHIEIYDLLIPYSALSDDATATAQGFEPTAVRVLALQPTATTGFDVLGEPRPTITPTITPTPPATIAATSSAPERSQIVNVCPVERVYTMDDLPPPWAVNGKMLLRSRDIPGNPIRVLQPETGLVAIDDSVLDCSNCTFSFDMNWVVQRNATGVMVSRPDGSDVVNLIDLIPASAPEIFAPRADGTRVYLAGEDRDLLNMEWFDLSTLQYQFEVYDTADDRQGAIRYTQRYNAATGEFSPPFRPEGFDPIIIDYQSPTTFTAQPDLDPHYVVVRLSFSTGQGRGYKYYLVDERTQEATYLMRISNEGNPEFRWHPHGDALYFRYVGAGSDEWYRLDTTTGEIGLLGLAPGGVWSRDAKLRFGQWFLSTEERQAREEAGDITTLVYVWNSDTGGITRFCVPQYTDLSTSSAIWSPDNRYLLFDGSYTIENEDDTVTTISNSLLFDSLTGYLTEFTSETLDLIVWMED